MKWMFKLAFFAVSLMGFVHTGEGKEDLQKVIDIRIN